jgi:predicted heme/steroid binding protein
MNIPNRMVSILELKHNTGERGTRKFIAYNGIVYDVTDCPKWCNDMHENLHFPGQDLSTEMEEAPHAEDVFTRPCVGIVGKLDVGSSEERSSHV